MSKISDNLNYFQTNHKEIYEAYSNYGKLIHKEGGPLDEKTRSLVKIAISSVGEHHLALETHIRKAIKAGCTLEEIEHVILLTAPSVGFPSMMESLLVFREFIEK